jgi:hypothetical protein
MVIYNLGIYIWLLVFCSALWVYKDALRLQTHRYKGINGAGIQFAGMLLAWIVSFPWYLICRSRIKNGTALLEDKYAEWYYMNKGSRNGPINFLQLEELVEASKIEHHDLVWGKGMANWIRACEVKELKSLFLSIPPPFAPPLVPAPASQHNPNCVPLPSSSLYTQPLSNNVAPDIGQAKLSLIFGILGIFPFFCILTIPGIILGHISLSKANEIPQKYGGKSMAKWGMGLSYFSLIFYLACGAFIGFAKASINNSLGR